MCDENTINNILFDWAARSSDGLLSESLTTPDLVALYESLVDNGISEEDSFAIVESVSIISEKGKYPERQAYNKDGLLVTFPTPAYKANAIKRGTHFEKDPRASQSNLFGGGQQAPNQASPTPTDSTPAPSMDSKQSELPQSDTSKPSTQPTQPSGPEPGSSGTPAAPPPSPSSASAPSTEPPAQGQLATEPIPQASTQPNVAPPKPATPPPQVQKTPEEIAAEKTVIKQILNTDDTLPTVAGVGGSGISEELNKLIRVAIDMNLSEAVKFLSKHL